MNKDIYDDFLINKEKINPFIDFPIDKNEELRAIEYRDIVKNRYYITSTGRIFSTFNNELKEMSQSDTSDYLHLKLSTINNGPKHFTIHRLVASAFVDKEKETDNVVNHKDGNKLNNTMSNLEWKDQYYNVHHAIANQLWGTELDKDPKKLNQIADALEENKKSMQEIAKEFGVSKSTLARIKDGAYSDVVGERIFPFRESLTDQELKEIFDLTRNQNKSFEEVAEIYDISPRTVREIYYANSSKNFSERLAKMGCIVTEWKISKPLSDQDAIEIFDKFNENNIEDLAKEYETTPETVKKVIHGLARYGELLRSNGRYPKEYSKNLDEEVICNIYKECRAKKKSYQQIADNYGIHLMTVRKIGCAMRGYKDILERNGFIIEKKNKSKKPGMSFEQAKEIYDEAVSGKGSRQIASERHIDRGVVDDIKFCRNAYEFLQTEYGLEPMQKKQN